MSHSPYFVQNRAGKTFTKTNSSLHSRLEIASPLSYLISLAIPSPDKLLDLQAFRERGYNDASAYEVSNTKEVLIPQNFRGNATILVTDGRVEVRTCARGTSQTTYSSSGEVIVVSQSYANMPTRTTISSLEPSRIVVLGQNPDRFVGM